MEKQPNRLKKTKILFDSNKIATLEDIKKEIGSNSRMTVYRLLCQMDYLSSYSHRGQYYTLPHIPDFDHDGLWSFKAVRFSKYGNLLNTTLNLVEFSEGGLTAQELESLLQVETQPALRKLWRQKKISRIKIGKIFVYLSSDSGERRRQELMRKENNLSDDLAVGLEPELLPDELRAGIILFFSLLDEKQRRLFAGLEAAKIGHGGDKKIAELLGLDSHTISKGRRELFSGSILRVGSRKKGGGRMSVEKKHLK